MMAEEEDKSRVLVEQFMAAVGNLLQRTGGSEATAGPSTRGVVGSSEVGLEDTSAQLEVFSGKGELTAAEWISRLELARQVGRWSEPKTMSVIFNKLTDAARLWHLSHGATEVSYDAWKEKFLSAYGAKASVAALLDALQRCKQENDEALDHYARRKERLAMQLGIRQSEIKDLILSGLAPKYRYLVHIMRGRQHRDVTELVNDIEDTIEFDDRMDGAGRLQSASVRGRVCFRCGLAGHVQANCRRSGASAGTQSRAGRGGLASQSGSRVTAPGSRQLGAQVEETSQRRPDRPVATRTEITDVGRNEENQRQRASTLALVCFRCRKEGHLARDCPAKSVRRLAQAATDANTSQADAIVAEREGVDVDPGVKYITVNGKKWRAKIDTEACISVVSESAARALGLRLMPTQMRQVRGIGGACAPLGECSISMEVDGRKRDDVKVLVLSDEAMNDDILLIGKPVLDKEDLLTVYHDGTALLLDAKAYPELVRMFPKPRPTRVKPIAKDDVVLSPKGVNLANASSNVPTTGRLVIDEQPCSVPCELYDSKMRISVLNLDVSEMVPKKNTVLKRAYCVNNDEIFQCRELLSGSTAAVQQVQPSKDHKRHCVMFDDNVPNEVN